MTDIHSKGATAGIDHVDQLGKDLQRKTRIGKKGDLICFITDLPQEGSIVETRHRQLAMLIVNERDPKQRHVYIPACHFWRILEPDAMTRFAPELAQRLYGFVTRQDCFRVLDALYEFAEDIKNAPPPRWASYAQWLEAMTLDGLIVTMNGQAHNG